MKKNNLAIGYWLLALIATIFLPNFTQAQKQNPEDELAQLFGPLINFEFAAPIESVIKNFG
ncbi:MAG: hypothetical protein KDD99_32990, partial [Bacteroidetes bacterium]|nr:hypothetical protein [Bacteroidota bacterium]